MSGCLCGIGNAGRFRQFLSRFGLWGQPFSGILNDRKRLKPSIKYIAGSDWHENTRQRLHYFLNEEEKTHVRQKGLISERVGKGLTQIQG